MSCVYMKLYDARKLIVSYSIMAIQTNKKILTSLYLPIGRIVKLDRLPERCDGIVATVHGDTGAGHDLVRIVIQRV